MLCWICSELTETHKERSGVFTFYFKQILNIACCFHCLLQTWPCYFYVDVEENKKYELTNYPALLVLREDMKTLFK